MNNYWVYILKCNDNSYYTGHTDDLEQRINQHVAGSIPSCYTAKRLPVSLVFQQAFETRAEALKSERQIKGWSRKKKQAMISGDWSKVSKLSKSSSKPYS